MSDHARRRPNRGWDDDDFAREGGRHDRREGRGPSSHASAPSGAPSATRAQPAALQERVRAVVKWFSAEKGFGFVQIEGGKDVFLHVSALERAGRADAPAGAALVCDVVQGGKGPQVGAIHAVEEPAAPAAPPPPKTADGAVHAGEVRFYNADRGFGFITRSDGAQIFVGRRALEFSGVAGLADGAKVRFTCRQGQKGPEVARIVP